MNVEVTPTNVIITLDRKKIARLAKSGRTRIVASSHGWRTGKVRINNQIVCVKAIAIARGVKPNPASRGVTSRGALERCWFA